MIITQCHGVGIVTRHYSRRCGALLHVGKGRFSQPRQKPVDDLCQLSRLVVANVVNGLRHPVDPASLDGLVCRFHSRLLAKVPFAAGTVRGRARYHNQRGARDQRPSVGGRSVPHLPDDLRLVVGAKDVVHSSTY